MFHRTRLSITAVFFCHLLLASTLVTSQLHPLSAEPLSAAAQAPAQAQGPSASETPESAELPLGAEPQAAAEREDVTIHAREQEKDGAIYKLRSDVEIDFRSLIFRG
ncbi:MAG: hypothetical protein JO187_03780, partial [Acidobacteria bacterium]|nr:hypothetical protein [Acidobacteriota bacterium]